MFQLAKSFVDEYRARPVVFGWGGLGEVVFYRTYSRDDNPYVNGRETWADVTERVINGMYSFQRAWCINNGVNWNEEKAQRSAREAFDLMFNMRWTPPGRGLSMMGTPFVMERGVTEALQNCFAGSEKFITKEYGAISFADTCGQTVTVWTEEGWKPALIRGFGEQALQEIMFVPGNAGKGIRRSRSNHSVTVKVTADHRWILADGTETTVLKVGDAILTERVEESKQTEAYREGYAHGLIFGDGCEITHRYANGDRGFELRACNEKKQRAALSVAERFDKVNYERPSANGDPIYYKRTPNDLKAFPVSTDPAYLSGFLDGWIDTDASITLAGNYKLGSTRIDALYWLCTNAAAGGYILTGYNVDNRDTNYGKRNLPVTCYTLSKNPETYWIVSSITPEVERAPVYCAVVSGLHRFTLASGAYTGNCGFVSTLYIEQERGDLFRWLMEMSMMGVGVGFDTRGAGRMTVKQPTPAVGVWSIPDTRQGWAKSVEMLIDAYFNGTAMPIFDYDSIRPKGTVIRGFGGVASGPEPLIRLHEQLTRLLTGYIGRPLDSRGIVDICNLIGCCVVAGNVRRSAEIAFGSRYDDDFINLKNYARNPERAGFGWVSNNSVFVQQGDDYTELAQRTWENGEPGYFWLENVRQYARMNGLLDLRDGSAMGTNPCAEQPLHHKELCTLVEIYLPRCQTKEEFGRAIKYAYLYGKSVTLGSDQIADPQSRGVMEENRRIGLSVTGVTQFLGVHGFNTLIDWFNYGYELTEYFDRLYSQWLGVGESIRRTSVKPSGTVSLVVGVTPGIHYNVTSRFHIRRVDLADNSPLVDPLMRAGYPMEPSIYTPGNLSVSFPVDAGIGVRSEDEVSTSEQLSLVALAQRHWADNAVSATVKFNRKTTTPDDLAQLLQRYDSQLKGISFLPIEHHGYAQAPYEGISDLTYYAMIADIKPLNLQGLGDSDKLADMYCDGAACAVPMKGA